MIINAIKYNNARYGLIVCGCIKMHTRTNIGFYNIYQKISFIQHQTFCRTRWIDLIWKRKSQWFDIFVQQIVLVYWKCVVVWKFHVIRKFWNW